MNPNIKNKLIQLLANTEADERETLYQLRKVVDDLASQSYATHESQSLSELVAENIQAIKEGNKTAHVIKTGFTDFDNNFAGLSYGELTIIGARPSMGKSLLTINLALNISVSIPMLYFTFDMSKSQLVNRFLSAISNIEARKILQQNLSETEKEVLLNASKILSERKVYINDSGNYSFSAIREICRKHIEENGVKVIFVDYLQMIGSGNNRNNREAEIGYITRGLKNIAKDFNVAVVVTSQLSRATETRGGDKKPILSDLRDSGAIEQEADKVVFLYRGEYYGLDCDENGDSSKNIAEVILAKNRNGGLGTVKLKRNINFTSFYNFEESENRELNEKEKVVFKKFQSRLSDLDLTDTPPTFDDDFLPPL